MEDGRYHKILFCLYALIWAFLAISPRYRSVWWDENILVFLFVGILLLTYKKFKFSNTSYSLIFIFMVLHSIGAHYSYAEMPLFDLIKDNYGLMRNHYDRFVHFLFGVLLFLPIYEILTRVFKVPKGWKGLSLAFISIVAFKGVFEVIEYIYTAVRNNNLTTTNYLGEQGDAFDALKDMGLGMIAGLMAWIVVGLKSLKKRVK
tara:strand:+ start:153 stop:761 length:609 start_codon:yes stop_codon:yes gene_type:complete